MKNLRTLVVFFLGAAAVTTTTRAGDPATEIPAQVRAFYRFYVHVLNTDGDALKNNRATMKRYVSARFLEELDKNSKSDGGEGDAFILAQDWEKSWEKNILVQKVEAHGETAKALVTLSGGEMKPDHLNLKFVHSAGSWKIDSVTDADQVLTEVPADTPAGSPAASPAAAQ